MLVSEAVGRTVHALGGEVVFGLMGSGNLAVTNAIVAAGGRFFSSRHETGAVCMADGYARVSGRLGVASVHQGPGLTNAITGLAEAAKSRTPVLLLAADTPSAQLRSNFRIDQDALVASVGAVPERVHTPQTAVADTARAVRRAVRERRTVVLNLPLDVQAAEIDLVPPPPAPELASVAPTDLAAVIEALNGAQRPAIIAGRGAVLSGAGPALRALGERLGAVLATSAVANGLFTGDPLDLGISGGFSTPLAQRELAAADVVIAFGAALNVWTTRHGKLVNGTVIQVDRDVEAIGAHRPVDLGVVGDARAVAEALLPHVTGRGREPLPEARRWRDEPYEESRDALDPRTLTIALDEILPAERTVVVDSGAFMGYPAMYLGVPDAHGFVFPQAFQCVGLALGNAIGAAVARPDRMTVCAVGDGGLQMSLPELDTLGRLGLDMVVIVYNDDAYGAEVHHFRPLGVPVELAQFPPVDFAALAEASMCQGLTVRTEDDLEGVKAWLHDRDRPLVVDAKVDPNICAEWLEEAFRGH
ncbi:thiamine pyrophosphate-binding protein [Solirubrobacter sp. CPCC 204708]|uniref:Thiamine pyrophosphate-binding protein n=1 Tax=Solirubrobacter deserti TaxID=2282478 RepID=A0ABT4RES8_9ACTN|nr:thiamine pyrophosphate-binding protein [Solirubrobacter deserti]MBE2318572.1 thiamine pyrophosphate-binding protein [Solirubrobacter deserti]MDA0137030.1 thiamine pyrophosphate-binding protein [Solirubrobacter deserti]